MLTSRLASAFLAVVIAATAAAAQTPKPPPASPPTPPTAPTAPAPPAAPAPVRERHRARDAERDHDQERDSERIVRTFKAGEGTTLVLSNLAGDIIVNGSGGGEITIEAIKRVTGRDDAEMKRFLEETRIEMDEHGSRIEVRTIHGGSRNRSRVNYTIAVPPATMLDLRSIAGDVTVSGIKGETRIETVSGSIVASGLSRATSLKAVSGDVSVSQATVDGDLVTGTVSGEISLAAVKARRIEAATVSGDVLLRSAWCEQIVARSVNGAVELSGALAPGGRYAFKSHSGDVRLFLDGKVGFEIEASTFSGTIKSDLPLKKDAGNESGGMGPHTRTIRGVFGDGSAQLEVATFSGNVYVGKK